MRTLAAALAVALAACHPSASLTELAPSRVVVIPPATPTASAAVLTPTASSSAPSPLESPPASIEGPSVLGCQLRAPQWKAQSGGIPLRFSPESPPYGRLFQGTDAVLSIGAAADAGHPILDLDAGGVVLRAHVDAGDFALHATRAFVVADALIPQASAPLGWTDAKPGVLALTLNLPSTLSLPPTASTHFQRPCADLGFVAGSFEPLVAIGGNGRTHSATLPSGRALRLSLNPGGPDAVELHPRAGDDLSVTVFEQAQGMSRIAWATGEVLAFGWLPSAMLLSAQGPPSARGSTIGLGSVGSLGGVVRCDHEVGLVAVVGSERRRVGRILPGTHLALELYVDAFQKVRVEGVHAGANGRSHLACEAIRACGMSMNRRRESVIDPRPGSSSATKRPPRRAPRRPQRSRSSVRYV